MYDKKLQFVIFTRTPTLIAPSDYAHSHYRTSCANMGGVRMITQKALHGLSGHRQVSIQEAVHLIDNQSLVICSEKFTTLSIRAGAKLVSEKDGKQKDIVSMYKNRPPSLNDMSMDEYFYKHFCKEVLKDDGDITERTKHRILLPKGQKFKPKYPVTYEYAKGVLTQHMPWTLDDPPTKLFQDKDKTIRKFKRMITRKEFPSSVCSQYICAVKYTRQKHLELLATEGTEQEFDLNNMDEADRAHYIAHQHGTHFSDNKVLLNDIDGMVVDIGKDVDWTIKTFTKKRKIKMHGTDWVEYARNENDTNSKAQATSVDNIVIPKTKDHKRYSVKGEPQQEEIVYTAVDTIIKFLQNDPSYKPMRATIMGCGGTGKSYIINTIIGMVRELTNSNNTVQVAAPSGAAAYNVQGSTLHRLLALGVNNPENPMSEMKKNRLKAQLERLLVLIIDERSMISSKLLAAAERNTRECIYGGHNSRELWGGMPVVLLFGDDYQLMPVKKDGAIHGYAKMQGHATLRRTEQMGRALTFAYRGDWLFTEVMTEQVYHLTKNYRVKDEHFKELLGRVRVAKHTEEDAKHIIKLHHSYYRVDKKLKKKIENHRKTMFLYSKTRQVADKNRDKLIETSKRKKVPVARMDCWYETNKQQNQKERRAYRSHFDMESYVQNNDFCVGSRVALKNWNILPSAGLYNGAMGTVVEIVYSNPVGPNDKEHYHLPDYVVVDFAHLNLPPNIRPWDSKHPTVSSYCTSTHTLTNKPHACTNKYCQYQLCQKTTP